MRSQVAVPSGPVVATVVRVATTVGGVTTAPVGWRPTVVW
jgi:hypothetical protein